MKSRLLSLLVAAVLLLLAFGPAAFGQQCFGGSLGIPDGNGVALAQVRWSFPGASGDGVSGTGQVDVNVPQLIAYTGQKGQGLSNGFINIVTKDDLGNIQWVVENLPILPGYPYVDISTMFYLNGGLAVTKINAGVCYSRDPFASPPLVQLSVFRVGSREFNAQGVAGGVLTAPPPPPFNVAFPNPFGIFKFRFQFDHSNQQGTNVEAADSQCFPASLANNLTWLKLTYGVQIPDPNDLGLRNTVMNSLVGKLDMTFWSDPRNVTEETPYCGTVVGRAAQSRINGCGVYSQWALRGYMTYLNAHNIALTLKHQGDDLNGFTGANNVTVGKLTSIGQGAIVQPDFIYNEIANYSAVEYADAHPFGGGHAMDIVAAGSVLGAPFIFYVSDHNQMDDKDGTQYIDASFLCAKGVTSFGSCNQDPTRAPVLWLGDEDGAYLTTVFTQRP